MALDLYIILLPIFYWKQDILEKKKVKLLKKIALIVLILQIILTALFLKRKKSKYFLNHFLLFLISLKDK